MKSSDESKQRVFSVAGIIGEDVAWDHLERAWLVRTQGIPFHANNCDSDHGDYASTGHAENKALYRALTELLAHSQLGGSGVSIDLMARNMTFPDSEDLAYYKGFLEVLVRMKNFGLNHNQKIKFTFDSRRESEYNTGFLYGMFRDQDEWRDCIFPEIAFACSREHPKVQVADLFAREAMKALDNQIGPSKRPPRLSWLALFDTGRFHIDVLGREYFESLKNQLPSLEKSTGMSRQKYHDWLLKYSLQHSVTNMFRFMEWEKHPFGKDAKSTSSSN